MNTLTPYPYTHQLSILAPHHLTGLVLSIDGHKLHQGMKLVVETTHGTVCMTISNMAMSGSRYDLVLLAMDASAPKYEILRNKALWPSTVYTIGVVSAQNPKVKTKAKPRVKPTIQFPIDRNILNQIEAHAKSAFDYWQYGTDLASALDIIKRIIAELFSEGATVTKASIANNMGIRMINI